MPKCVVMGYGGNHVKVDSDLMRLIHKRAERAYLRKQYHLTRDNCYVCGASISTMYGEPLGRYFVMDKKGKFYCMHCDHKFDDMDERIYVPEEDENDE